MKFALRDIEPNPWRRMDRYPIRRDKVDALKESIASTDWWNNVVARRKPGDPSKAEIAYGHHRRQALRELHDLDTEVELNIRDLTDQMMIQMMARENMEEWGSSAAAQHETVRTIVEAFAQGAIDLPRSRVRTGKGKLAGKEQDVIAGKEAGRTVKELAGEYQVAEGTIRKIVAHDGYPEGSRATDFYGVNGVRVAPGFTVREVTPGTDLNKAYTIRDIAEFTGWLQADGEPQHKVKHALMVLEVIELGLLTEKDFEELSSWKAGAIAERARRELKSRRQLASLEPRPEVRERILQEGHQDTSALARHIIKDLTSRTRGTAHIEEAAIASGKALPRAPKEPPQIDVFAARLAANFSGLLAPSPSNKRVNNLELLLTFQDKTSLRSRQELAAVLRQLAERAASYAARLETAEHTPHLTLALEAGETA